MEPKKDPTRDAYDQNAAQIAERFWAIELLRQWDLFCAALPQEARVIDLGCGPGRDVAEFMRRGFWTTGLDYSAGLLCEAARRTPAPYLRANLRHLPFPPAVFDGAWFNASLLHLPRQDAPYTLLGVRRILKPGAVLYLSLKRGAGERWEKREGKRFFTYYQEDEIITLLESIGFVITQFFIEPGKTVSWLNIFARKD